MMRLCRSSMYARISALSDWSTAAQVVVAAAAVAGASDRMPYSPVGWLFKGPCAVVRVTAERSGGKVRWRAHRDAGPARDRALG